MGPKFKLIQAFIVVLITCKNDEDQSKHELTRVLTTFQQNKGALECLTRDRGAEGSSLNGITALWSLSKTHLS